MAKDLGDLHYFRGWHANRGKSNFYFKVSGFVQELIYDIFTSLCTIFIEVMIILSYYMESCDFAWHDIIGILILVHGIGMSP